MTSARAAIAIAEKVTGRRLQPEWLAPLASDLRRWSTRSLPRRPTLGPCGVLLSTHLTANGAGALRCDVDPLWEIDDPRRVHTLVDALLDATGQAAVAGFAHRLLSSAAWPPPGIGPGPYLGVGVNAAGVPVVRVWTPLMVHPAPTPSALLKVAGFSAEAAETADAASAAPFQMRFAGIELAAGRVAKLSLYLRARDGSGVESVQDRVARLGLGEVGPTVAGLARAAAAAADPWTGLALRLAAGARTWTPVVEIGWGGSPAQPVLDWLAMLGWSRAATALAQILDSGPCLWIVTVAGVRQPSDWIAVYFAPRNLPIAAGRRVPMPRQLREEVGTPDSPDAMAQSVTDWRGSVHTASWEDGSPLRWRTIGEPAPPRTS